MFACLYNSLMWSMFISVCLFLDTWLEMRVNLGLVFFGLTLLLFLFQMFITPMRKFCATFEASTFSFVFACAGLWLVLGCERLKVIPASIIREGIMQTGLSFQDINIALLIIGVGGWGLAYITTKR